MVIHSPTLLFSFLTNESYQPTQHTPTITHSPMSGAVSRFVKAPLPVYDAIGKAFALDDKKGVNVAIETGAEMLIKVCCCVNGYLIFTF